MRPIRTVLTVVCLASTVRGTAAAQLVPASPAARMDRVRALGTAAQALLSDGRRQSPRFASLLQAIDSSDLIVYVATGFLRLPARLADGGSPTRRVTENALSEGA